MLMCKWGWLYANHSDDYQITPFWKIISLNVLGEFCEHYSMSTNPCYVQFKLLIYCVFFCSARESQTSSRLSACGCQSSFPTRLCLHPLCAGVCLAPAAHDSYSTNTHIIERERGGGSLIKALWDLFWALQSKGH